MRLHAVGKIAHVAEPRSRGLGPSRVHGGAPVEEKAAA